jgi:hypothetical protein
MRFPATSEPDAAARVPRGDAEAGRAGTIGPGPKWEPTVLEHSAPSISNGLDSRLDAASLGCRRAV